MTHSEERGCGHERTVQTKTDYVADVGTSGGEELYGRERVTVQEYYSS
jgi:hypothetical protein